MNDDMKNNKHSKYSMKTIRIRKARTNNLKNISLDIPRNKLVTFTGPSGAGKTSIAIDTLYLEGYRRYIQSLPNYAKQILGVPKQPLFESIEGLSPAIAITENINRYNSRSTVGTITQINDYLRLLYAKIGVSYCPEHKIPLKATSISQIADLILEWPAGIIRFAILAPVTINPKGNLNELLLMLMASGYIRARISKVFFDIDQIKPSDIKGNKKIDIIIDRLINRTENRQRLLDSLKRASELSDGHITIKNLENNWEKSFFIKSECPHCNYKAPTLEPRFFSKNNPHAISCKPYKYTLLMDNQSFSKKQEGLSIHEMESLSISECSTWIKTKIQLNNFTKKIAAPIIYEINKRLEFLEKIGLNYLSLNRNSKSLSRGEIQRLRLARQISSGLSGIMYVIDEPSIGLHQKDKINLISFLKKLRDLGNSIILVEHDEEIIRCSDWIVDIGPEAGGKGGYILAQGKINNIKKDLKSLTGQYLSGKRFIPIPKRRDINNSTHWLSLQGATGNNLKYVNLNVPIGRTTCITGVSGSGKSTLINETLAIAISKHLNPSTRKKPAPYFSLYGIEHFSRILNINADDIIKTQRSNVATYMNIFSKIRELFSNVPESRLRGYKANHFSFNIPGGRCEICHGLGTKTNEMYFLPDMHIPCEYCHGKRFNKETLEILYRGSNICDVLDFTIEKSIQHFNSIPIIRKKLERLIAVGLSYIKLGQDFSTLSQGEIQRIKISLELSKFNIGKTLYIFDEPSKGLHFQDIELLLSMFEKLTSTGNTVVIIEHNLHIIKTADWIIDMGPGSNEQGGEIVTEGTPETVASSRKGFTAKYLKKILHLNR